MVLTVIIRLKAPDRAPLFHLQMCTSASRKVGNLVAIGVLQAFESVISVEVIDQEDAQLRE